MTDRTRAALLLLAVALLLGVVADTTLRATPWGLNAALWCLLVAGAALVAGWRRQHAAAERWLLLTAAGFALALAWRDSPALKALDVLAALTLLSLTALRRPIWNVRRASITDYALAATGAGLDTLAQPAALLSHDVAWGQVGGGRRMRTVAATGRGIVIAVPLLVVFGGLFVAADAVFAEMVRSSVRTELTALTRHALIIGVCAWPVAGFLRGLERGSSVPLLDVPRPLYRLGFVEVATVLALLDLLFLAFVLVQFRYFFGGADVVEASTHLTYAQYARHGFFELVTVAALALPLLLLAHALIGGARPGQSRLFRLLAGALVALLFVIMLSALQRMRLYQREYGLTELRVYTTAFMGWLAAVFLWLCVTVLRSRRERFAFGALVLGLTAIALLHAVNPDALIVRVNAARAEDGHDFDAAYLTGLSADSVPPLIRALPSLSPLDRCRVAEALARRWPAGTSQDWRTWSWSRWRAQSDVDAHRAEIEAARCERGRT